jgi:putative transposase
MQNSNAIFHNYIRQHEGLDGRTPFEACGIAIVENDKWRALIENASHKL